MQERIIACTRCVMDTTDIDITFNDKGECNHCQSFYNNIQQQTYQGEESDRALQTIIEKIKSSKKGKYDCIVGISGGVDSCYVAHLCKENGLNPLLMHLDNGWDSEIAVQNVKEIASRLELDYVSYVIDWREFKEIQLAFLRSSIVDLEIPTDTAIPASLHETACKHKIKYLISGGNYTSEGILPITWGYHVMKDMKLYKHIVNKYSKIPLKKTPIIGIFKEFKYKFLKGHRTVYILNYINYNKDAAKQLLIEKYGWRDYGGKHGESRYTAFWQTYILPKKHQIDYRKATYSTMICAGQMQRSEAMELLQKTSYDEAKIKEEQQYLIKKFGISNEEFETIMQREPKNYRNFPNSEKWIQFVHSMYRKLFPGKRL